MDFPRCPLCRFTPIFVDEKPVRRGVLGLCVPASRPEFIGKRIDGHIEVLHARKPHLPFGVLDCQRPVSLAAKAWLDPDLEDSAITRYLAESPVRRVDRPQREPDSLSFKADEAAIYLSLYRHRKQVGDERVEHLLLGVRVLALAIVRGQHFAEHGVVVLPQLSVINRCGHPISSQARASARRRSASSVSSSRCRRRGTPCRPRRTARLISRRASAQTTA